jgi:hypothetical protein
MGKCFLELIMVADIDKLTKQEIHDTLLDKYAIEISDFEGHNWTKSEALNILRYEMRINGILF